MTEPEEKIFNPEGENLVLDDQAAALNADYEPRPEVVDIFVTGEKETQAALNAINQQLAEQESVTLETLVSLPPEQRTGAVLKKIEELHTEDFNKILKSPDRPRWFQGMYSFFMFIISPIINLMTNTAIPNQRYLEQELKKDHRPGLPDPQSLIRWWLRNRGEEERVKDSLARLGYMDQDIDLFKELGDAIPGVQDIIQFMVREVYDPAAVSKYKMDDFFSGLYANAKKDADNAGVSENTLRKFWRAHWKLPGIAQAFEMLHRGVINKDDVRTILRIGDVMPGFIEPLVDISYTPLTRVDVRRIADYLDKDDAWIKKQYMNLGYNDENAQIMAEFSRAWIDDKADSEQTRKDKERNKERDLTKGDIISLYKLDLLPRTDAVYMLKSLRYDESEAELFIERIDMQKELDLLDKRETALKKQYVNGLISKLDISTRMDSLGIPQKKRDALLELWTVDRELRADRPTKGEILGWLKKGMLTQEQAAEELSGLGYSNRYVNLYITGTIGESQNV